VANPNVAPVASAVSISGTAQFNQLVTGNYTYSDADGDAQGASTFRWLRNGTTVVGTNQTYTTVSADVGQTLTLEVTPVALTGVSPGAPVSSAGVVIGKLRRPRLLIVRQALLIRVQPRRLAQLQQQVRVD
jgi:hypothetical protein